MRTNNLVKYREFPHFELHEIGMTGLVLETPSINDTCGELMAPVMWSQERRPSNPDNIHWEYVEDLEVIYA